jgi:hypothetical protein
MYLYLGFAAPLPEHHLLHVLIVYVLHSLMGRNQSPLKFSVRPEIFCDMEFFEVDIFAGITA